MKTPFVQLVSFGDSFSDNDFTDGYGFRSYTNTDVWTEQLAGFLGVPHLGLAWGGAMSDHRNYANYNDPNAWSGLRWQVDQYLAEVQGADLSAILFTIMCGSNDVWGGRSDPEWTAGNIRAAAAKLARAGARHILYRETTAVIMAPGYLEGEYAYLRDDWAKLVNGANKATKIQFAELAKEFPNLKIYYQETDLLFTKIKNGAEGFKFEILDRKWFDSHIYPAPGGYLWYDEWHPMGRAHKLMAEESLETLRAALAK